MDGMTFRALSLGWLCAALSLASGFSCGPQLAPDTFVCDPSARPWMYPAPRGADVGAATAPVHSACLDATALTSHDRLDAIASVLLAESNVPLVANPAEGCDWKLRVTLQAPDATAELLGLWKGAEGIAERYAMKSIPTAAGAETTLHAANERAAVFALRGAIAATAADADGTRMVGPATIVDWPAFATRGVIEGFYGTPFTRQDRVTMIELLAAVRGNTYAYGPKNDPYSHALWREPYPADQLDDLRAAAEAARASMIDFVWAVGPGLWTMDIPPGNSISYASDADFAVLTSRFEELRGAGIGRFGLLLDDIYEDFAWDEDRARFPGLVDAHVFLANRVQTWMAEKDPDARLLFVGMRYANSQDGWEDYASALAQSLDPGIDVMWTGPDVVPSTITREDLEAARQKLGRKPVLWDNYPVQVGPLAGRAPDLGLTVSGLLANPVIGELGGTPLGEYWKVLGTVGDYTWLPESYEPNASYERWRQVMCSVQPPGP